MTDILNQETIESLREMGDDFLSELIQTFLDSSRKEIERIRREIEDGNASGAGDAAHCLKGACLGQGAEEMAGLCREIESRGDAGKLEGAGELLKQLEEAFRRASRELVRLHPRG